MAIVCEYCKKETVDIDGLNCEKCEQIIAESKVDKSYLNRVYLPNDLYQEFVNHVKNIENEEKDSKKLFGKFMSKLKTSFIDKKNGKEINDPTPMTIVPKHSTLDRIQKILNHNINVYADENNMETIESMQDFNVNDPSTEIFEKSIYQHVDEVMQMEEEELLPPEEEVPEEKKETNKDQEENKQ